MNRRCSGRHPVRVQKPATHGLLRSSMKCAQRTRALAPPPDAKRPLRVSPCQRSVIPCPSESWCLVWSMWQCHVKEFRGCGTRSCASTGPASRHRGGQRNQRRKRASTYAEVRTGCVWPATPPFAHAGRSFDVPRWKVGHSQHNGIIKPLLGRSSNLYRSARSLWLKRPKSTVPWLRVRTIASSREFSITMVHSFVLP